MKEANNIGVPAKCVNFSHDNVGKFEDCYIIDYNDKTDKFMVKFMNKTMSVWQHKLYVNFKTDDPLNYVSRIRNAFIERETAYKHIQYNFYIDNMPMRDLPSLNDEQKDILYEYMKNKRVKSPKSNNIALDIMNECLFDYARCQNKMIFERYIPHYEGNILIKSFKLPEKEKEKDCRDNGKMKIPFKKKKFKKRSEIYKLNNLYIAPSILVALTEIRKECDSIETLSVFKTDIEK